MDAKAAANTIRILDQQGLEVYVDGGWAVDALLGEQTRPHADLDIAIPHRQVETFRAILAGQAFREFKRDDSWECNFVLVDEVGHRLGVHSYELDLAGNNMFGITYKGEDLAGRGFIDGYPVRCITPASLVRFHTGYEADEDDYHDVRLLCSRFGIVLPVEYRRFVE